MNYKDISKKIRKDIPEIKIASQSDGNLFLNICDILSSSNNLSKRNIIRSYRECKENNPVTKNDYYLNVFCAISGDSITKVAYPQPYGRSIYDFEEPYDLNKWAKIVHKIFEYIEKTSSTFSNALEVVSSANINDEREVDGFKKWLTYYQKGEHLKYNSRNDEMKKEAYEFSPTGLGFYDTAVNPDLSGNNAINQAKTKMKKNDEYKSWKAKLHTTIRRLDKLIRMSDDYIDPEDQYDLANLLHSLDLDVRKVRLKSTASDLSFRAAMGMKKAGFKIGHDELIKLSQEIEDDATQSPEEFSPEDQVESAPTADQSISGTDAEISEALSKLESVSANLAKRDVIRSLAEFDILLDKIGIASLFPELSEAQSKLIDAYSYALVRVTKMLGMLSSGKSISEISNAKKDDEESRMKRDADKVFNPEEEGSSSQDKTEAIQEGVSESQPEASPESIPQ